MAQEKTLRITQVRSSIDRPQKQRLTLAALGLRRIRHVVEHKNSPQLQGMLAKVTHLIEVEEV
jgi:large subunit ribosomal protein L30